MSQFDHESDDQSALANEEVRLNKQQYESGAAIMAAYRQEKEHQARRNAYRRSNAKDHLADELYKAIAGAVAHYQNYLKSEPPPIPADPFWHANTYRPDPREHFVRSLHAMIFQELDLYLEEHDRAIVHEIQEVRQKIQQEDTQL
jgi:hypothetical protein